MSERNLIAVIDAIIAIAPDLQSLLEDRRTSCAYTAPELMPLRWGEVADLLNNEAREHQKRKEIAAIFSGREARR